MNNDVERNGPVRAAIYKRVSSLEQVNGGYSIADQEQACREYLDNRYGRGGYTAKVYADEGISGTLGFARPGSEVKNVRPSLSALVQDMADRKIDVLVVWRLDRIGRNARAWHELLDDFITRYRVELISVQERVDTTTPMGKFFAGHLALASELFARITAENVSAALKRRREAGYPTGAPGYAWRRDGKRNKLD